MHHHIACIEHIPTAPTCPACGHHYELSFFDRDEGRARCPGCPTLYLVPQSYQPSCPDDFLELGPLTPSQVDALEQFRDDLTAVAEAAGGASNNASYDLYVHIFSDACAPLLDPELREHALTIARQFGFSPDADESEDQLAPDLCPFTGIDEDHCPCGRHP